MVLLAGTGVPVAMGMAARNCGVRSFEWLESRWIVLSALRLPPAVHVDLTVEKKEILGLGCLRDT